MSIPYLKNLPWSLWTRDERFFCSILYSLASSDPAGFAAWLIESTGLPAKKRGKWDLGYEICLYRDYLWQLGKSARCMRLPQKRTFDLCLFGTRTLIVIEAKVFERFERRQNRSFELDKQQIQSLPGLERVNVYIIALASSKYFANAVKYGYPGSLSIFDGRVSWSQVAQKYPSPLLDQADRIYKMGPGGMLDEGSAKQGDAAAGQLAARLARR